MMDMYIDMNINQENMMNMNMHQVNNNFLIEPMESMMKNFQNHNQISDKEKINVERNQIINANFRASDQDKRIQILIQCLPDEKIKNFRHYSKI